MDIDGAGSTSDEAAQAIKRSMEKLGNSFICFFGIITDSGGGGVLKSLVEAMVSYELINSEHCAIAGYSLHIIQLIFKNGMIAAFGNGANEIRNVLQMVYCCYALQA